MQRLFTRRTILKTLSAAALFTPVLFAEAADKLSESVSLDVYKDETCGCCGNWIEHMTQNSFVSTIHHPADLTRVKLDLGIGYPLQSCHTAVTVEGYLFEGHVPAKLVRQFLAAPPENALGLAVPGMPLGSPGMEVGDQFTPYDVVLFRKDGSTSVFVRLETAAQQY